VALAQHQPLFFPVVATQHVHVCGVHTLLLFGVFAWQAHAFQISQHCSQSAAAAVPSLCAQAVVCLVDLVLGGMHDIVFGLPTHTLLIN
jgi:hypothetical protein